MNPCHICERIIRLEKALSCQSCPKIFCYPCLAKYYPTKVNQIVPKTQNLTPLNLKIKECLICLKQCSCYKCTEKEQVFIRSNNNQIDIQNLKITHSIVSEDEPIPQNGIFKGRKISELPLYHQRIYLKKKALYSIHQCSQIHNDTINIQQNNERDDKQKEIGEDKDKKDAEQSINQNIQEGNIVIRIEGEKMQNEDQEEDDERVEDYQSQYAGRRAAHLHLNQHSENLANNAASEEINDNLEAPQSAGSSQFEGSSQINGSVDEKRKGSKIVQQPSQNLQNDESSSSQIIPE